MGGRHHGRTRVPSDTRRTPGILFLGFCDRAASVREGNTDFLKWNILGLKQVVLSHVYPLPLRGLTVVLSISVDSVRKDHKLQLADAAGAIVGTIGVSFQVAESGAPMQPLRRAEPLVHYPEVGWMTAALEIPTSDIVIERPGAYSVVLAGDDEQIPIGQVHFALVDPPPLSAERVAAIRSDPSASKFVRIVIACKHCATKFRAYAALERSEQLESESWQWYQDAPDFFDCECGKTRIELISIRRNLHGFLGRSNAERQVVNLAPLYEIGAIETLRTDFIALLGSQPSEEAVHQFIK